MGTRNQTEASGIQHAIASLTRAIATRHSRTRRLLLLGIANGGIVLARRLADQLALAGLKPGLGTIDISFHRDDIGRNPIPKEAMPTMIPHDVNGATVILVDDVLHSGRTVKAALDELFDHGRPERVELAVLVDRGGHRLPFAADHVGMRLDVEDDRKVRVRLDATHPARDTLEVTPAGTATPSAHS